MKNGSLKEAKYNRLTIEEREETAICLNAGMTVSDSAGYFRKRQKYRFTGNPAGSPDKSVC
jgi:hypothetical protein